MFKKYGYALLTFVFIASVISLSPVWKPIPTVEAATECINLVNSLHLGSSDASTSGEVTKLQNFLVSGGYATFTARGTFGRLTEQGVKKFQTSQGIFSGGLVGPLTRAKIKSLTCGGDTSTKVSITSISPTRGAIGMRVTLSGSGFTKTGNTINFGSGAISALSSTNGTSLSFLVPKILTRACPPNSACTHSAINVEPGTYQVSVSNSNGRSQIVSFTVTTGTQTPSPTIKIISPNGGESWTVGNTKTVSWVTSNLPTGAVVVLSLADGPTTGTLITKISSRSSDSITFALPKYAIQGGDAYNNIQSGSYHIKATLYDKEPCGYGSGECIPEKILASDSSDGRINIISSTTKIPPVTSPTALLTANDSHDLVVNVGDLINYHWRSTNGASFTSVYSNSCAPGAIGEWSANSASGDTSGIAVADLAIDRGTGAATGCTYVITYSVNGTNGEIVQDSVTIRVNPSSRNTIPGPEPLPVYPSGCDSIYSNCIQPANNGASIMEALTNLISNNSNYLLGNVRTTILELFDQLQQATGTQ